MNITHQDKNGITIDLTKQECEVLAIIMNNIGGPLTGMRSVSDEMHTMLYYAGYKPPLWSSETGTIMLGDFK